MNQIIRAIFLAGIMFASTSTVVAENEPARTLSIDYKVYLDGELMAHPMQTFPAGQGATLDLVTETLRLSLSMPRDMCARADLLFPGRPTSSEEDCALVEAELQAKTLNDTWETFSSPMTLARIGTTATLQQDVSLPNGNLVSLRVEALLSKN